MRSGGTVKIKMPNIDLGTFGIFSSRRATVKTGDGKILWEGLHGQTANFEIENPVGIIRQMGKPVRRQDRTAEEIRLRSGHGYSLESDLSPN